jgi:transposase
MHHHSEAFIGLDTSKLRNAVAVAEAGRAGEVRFLGEIEASVAATAKLVRKLAGKYPRLTFCYEAGPTGYGLYRHIKSLGHECMVVAPSLIPKRPGDRVKTNRRDAVSLARLLRAGELTAVWVPDRAHEAVRDLSRAREAAVMDLRSKRQQLSALLLRQERVYPEGRQTWSKTHISWLSGQKFDYPEQRLVFEEMMLAMRQAQERLVRLEEAISAAVPDWSLAPYVTALMAMRGMDLIATATVLAEIGDLTRFRTANELMAYLGLVPSEDSTGDKVKRGSITKAGNRRARRMLVECAWSYQHPPRVGRTKQAKVDAAPPAVREIAWKAQCRLYRRYRALIRRGKLKTVAITAIASSPASCGPSAAKSTLPLSRKAEEEPASNHTPTYQGALRRGIRPAKINLVQRRERSRGKGNSRSRCVADRRIDARPQTGTAPDGKRICENPRIRGC